LEGDVRETGVEDVKPPKLGPVRVS